MSEHGGGGEETPEGGTEDTGEKRSIVNANLSDLRARLEELQDSVQQLGASGGDWSVEDETYAPPPPPPAPWPSPPATSYEPSPFEPPSYEPPPAAPEPHPGYGYEYAPPPPPPPPWRAGPEPEPLTYPAPPAATNGHTTESVDPAEISARSATVAIVDAGPFADLIDLRHFEDDLAALPAVRDVRVRRFGQSRANIEVGMTAPYALSRELHRLDRPMEIADGPEGEVLIELAPLADREPDPDGELEPDPDPDHREGEA